MRALRLTGDILRQTFQDLWAHRLRSFLTMFGIAWGMMSLLLLGSVGEGFRQGQRKQMEQWFQDVIMLWGGRVRSEVIPGLTSRWLQFTEHDCRLIMERCPAVRTCAPVLGRGNIVTESDHNQAQFGVQGAWPNLQGPRYLPIAEGRFLRDADVEEARRVAILGDEVYRQLFPSRPGVGGRIRLNQVPFDVIGVLQRIGKEGRGGANSGIIIPLSTAQRYFPHPRAWAVPGIVSQLLVQPRSADLHKEAMEQYHRVLGARHGIDPNDKDAFDEWDTIEGSRRVDAVMQSMDVFLGSVGVVTLALGAIGVMNIMLVAVSERTHEIGVRKAVGATQRDILLLFLLEGLAMIAISGGAGLALGWGISRGLRQLPMPEGFLPPTVTWPLGLLALAVLATVALAASLIPARQAARLQPVEALRFEL
jgi:putative ABC transport system permease protein